ncbi:MAG: hypothetical protein JWO84_808, partial [Parcubacteria group bacterium]|nr:hypothetical protein [Parcubacteria group bacterium]
MSVTPDKETLRGFLFLPLSYSLPCKEAGMADTTEQ